MLLRQARAIFLRPFLRLLRVVSQASCQLRALLG
jgi:hypothetical protein